MNIAILGAGAIARTMATTLQPLRDVTCYAVAARDLNRAQVFADKFGFAHAYGSYSDMLEDPNVELVYIATPHSLHYEHIKMCLNHGKHVLCEKAFCANARQAEEVLKMAEERGLLLTEAMWTRYMPMRRTINAVIKTGMIGRPTSLSANLGYPLEHKERLVKLDLCGGALMDLGVYVLNFAAMVFGTEITGLAANCIKLDSGVDAQETIMLTYEDGRMASLYCTMTAQTDRRGVINGTNGYIEIENINNYESISVYNLERKVIAQYAAPCQVTGYEYEVMSAIKAIREGQIECPEMTHYDTLVIMQLLDSIRDAWDLKFPYSVERLDSDPDMAHALADASVDPNEQRIKEAKERVVPVEKPGRPMSVLPETPATSEGTSEKSTGTSQSDDTVKASVSAEKITAAEATENADKATLTDNSENVDNSETASLAQEAGMHESVMQENSVEAKSVTSTSKDEFVEISSDMYEGVDIDESETVDTTDAPLTDESYVTTEADDTSAATEEAGDGDESAVFEETVDADTSVLFEEVGEVDVSGVFDETENVESAEDENTAEVSFAENDSIEFSDEFTTVENDGTYEDSDDLFVTEEFEEIEEFVDDEEEFRIWEDDDITFVDLPKEEIEEDDEETKESNNKYLSRLESMLMSSDGKRSSKRSEERKLKRAAKQKEKEKQREKEKSSDSSFQYDSNLYDWLDE